MRLSSFSAHLGSNGTSGFLIIRILFMFTLNIYFVTPMTLLLILSQFLYQHKRFPLVHHIRYLFCLSATVDQFWWRFLESSIIKNAVELPTKWHHSCDCLKSEVTCLHVFIKHLSAIINFRGRRLLYLCCWHVRLIFVKGFI